MRVILLKKIILIVFITISSFFLLDFLGFNDLKGNTYETSSSWKGEDIGFIPQLSINYSSAYEPFSTIAFNPSAIDSNKIYVIESALDLYLFARATREANRLAYLSLDYVLGKDIDYYEIVQQNIDQRFIPIGFIDAFNGTFDGQGYEISNLFFQTILSEEAYNQNFFGLRFYSMFSKIGTSGVVKNFGLVNPIMIQPIEWGIMNHASFIAGENRGLIEHVYVRDTRGVNAGMSVEGAFHLSGLVSVNYGTIRQAYLASAHVRSIPVLDYETTNVGFYQNFGVIENVYYDQSIYTDSGATNLNITPLSTAQFLNHNLFSSAWYFKDSYLPLSTNPSEHSQLMLSHQYPILQGLDVEDGKLLIESAVQFSYMNKLLTTSGLFRNSTYEIIHDLDMKQLASDNYQAASVAFSGRLTSRSVTPLSVLYPRFSNQGGDPNNHTIINLSIEKGTEIGIYTSYALFPALFGKVDNLNFANLNIDTTDISAYTHKSKILVGAIAGEMIGSTIENVHVEGNIVVSTSTTPQTKLYVGGLVGEGDGTLSRVSTYGNLTVDTQIYQTKSNHSAVGGLIGYTDGLNLYEGINAMAILSFGYQTKNPSTIYVGGLIGSGEIQKLERSINSGHIVSMKPESYQSEIYMGGIIGMQLTQMMPINQIYNQGNLDLYINQQMKSRLSGYGFVSYNPVVLDQIFDVNSITNSGRIRTLYPSGVTLSSTEIAQMDILVSGVYQADGIRAAFTGLFNEGNILVDIASVREVAGILNLKNTLNSTLIQSYQTGSITLTTGQVINREVTKVAGIALSDHTSYTHLRNDGDIQITIQNQTVIPGRILLMGLFENLSQNQIAKDLFNGGDLSITQSTGSSVSLDLFVSGINHRHQNTNDYQIKNINYQSVNRLNENQGAMHNLLNNGNLSITGSFNGASLISGITMLNGGMITQAINLGNIRNDNQTTLANATIGSAGITYALTSGYGQIKDSANYGKIESIQTGTLGFALASGLVGRNDLDMNLAKVSSASNNRYAKIAFSINYGNVYAYNGTSETAYTISQETRSKAAGIFGQGLLSIINTINYADIHSNRLAAGILGFMDLQTFSSYQSNQVFIGNNQNYGKIRSITAYSTEYSINYSSMPAYQIYLAYGNFIGKIHTGTATWEILSNSPSDVTPIDYLNFGYYLNFDSMSNLLGNAPETTMDATLAENALGSELLLDILTQFSTTNPNDTSVHPFSLKYLGTWPKLGAYGMKIKSYTNDESADGIFFSNFPFRVLPVYNYGSRQYLKNFFEFVKREDMNPVLLSRIEFNQIEPVYGIYAAAPSTGVSEGILIPDHFDLDQLNPHSMDGLVDTTWLGSDSDIESIIYKMTKGMQQYDQTVAVTIYDLELEQIDEFGNVISSGLTLRSPEINESLGLITYYLPSNASVIAGPEPPTYQTVSFVETGVGLGTMVPHIYENGTWTYKWVGTHAKINNVFTQIGLYHTLGNRNLSFTYMSSYNEINNTNSGAIARYNQVASDALSPRNFIYFHEPHVRVTIGASYRWRGYASWQVSSVTNVTSGNGMYRQITPTGLPTYRSPGVFEYVGPTQYEVTYIKTDPTPTKVYDPSTVRFQAKTESGSYQISFGASLYADGQPVRTPVSIPRGYGIYDILINNANDQVLDELSTHYGSIRIYASGYSPSNPTAYRDYQIRIIRTANQSLTGLDLLEVNGMNAKPLSLPNFRDVTATSDVYFKEDGILGTLEFTYGILNSYNGYNVRPLIELFDNNTNTKITSSFYRWSGGLVINTNSFNNLTGEWGLGTVNAMLTISDRMPSSDYRIELELITGELAIIYFTKMPSNEAFVTEITFKNRTYDTNELTSLTQDIPYGIYYDPTDAKTNFVNFTNLSTYLDVTSEQVSLGLIPSYLDGIKISPFSTIEMVDIVIDDSLGDRYQYIITYHLMAEDGSNSHTFTHILRELQMTNNITYLYQNGGQVELPVTELQIPYNEAPTIRTHYALDRMYFSLDETIDVEISFIPADGESMALANVDYFIRGIYGVGYEVDFNQLIPIGTYTILSSFSRTVDVLGESLTWEITFENVVIVKLKNDDSKLKNILFVSETVFAGFDTIVDIEAITEEAYLNYLTNPSSRLMSVLPSTGIYYGNYANYSTYWIIGQVQKTNLTVYQPTFEIPDFAKIRRVIDFDNPHYDYQSENLFADFTIADLGFNYILYRVYAHDYDENPENYTDYYISVQDVTNNIKFNLTVINETNLMIERVYVKIRIYPYGDDYQGEYDFNQVVASMATYSHYDSNTNTYINSQFQTTMGGTYVLEVILPEGFRYEIEVQQSAITSGGFYLESTLLPRKYYVTVKIYEDSIPETPWGQRDIIDYQPAE